MDMTDPYLGQSEESKDGGRQENGVRIGWVSQCGLPGGGSILGKVSRRGIILGQEEVYTVKFKSLAGVMNFLPKAILIWSEWYHRQLPT